jgi:hypothetical protein
MTLYFILGYFLVTLLVIYFHPRILVWTGIMALYFILVHFVFYTHINHVVAYFFAIMSAIIAIFCGIKPLRLIISKSIFAKAHNVLPSISETEQLALNAGDPWYEQEVFRGQPNFEMLHNIKKFALTPEEQSFLDNETVQLCTLLNDWDIVNKTRDLSVEAWNYIREHKFFGLVIAKQYGGLGFSAAAHSQIVMKIATRSPSAAVCVMVPNSLGPGELLY